MADGGTSEIDSILVCLNSLGSSAALMNTADIGILLTSGASSDACGSAYLRPLYYNNDNYPPVGWVGKDCNVNTLAHEIGHILGARHNREISSSTFNDDNFGFGYLIRGTNAATVMA